ncbi:hypothetical protein [Haemophilus influenzae]|uniref:Uncharachterised protein n=1 Tax=Haemophilus influenzae F3047 TaxID=935897 RepID=A0AAV2U448_HAEIF|nr:hypothetical protein [Haemophilus influenzae]CBY86186.1 Putative uncharachterised protein [Haemophilus influenzae F3047]
MCETAIQASGKFFLRKTKDGKYRLSFTLFDNSSTSVEKIQARQILLQSFLLDLHQEKNCLDVGHVCIRNSDEVLASVHSLCDDERKQIFKRINAEVLFCIICNKFINLIFNHSLGSFVNRE